MEELEKAAVMADDYALTHQMSGKSGNPGSMVQVIQKIYPEIRMIERDKILQQKHRPIYYVFYNTSLYSC